MKARRMSAGDRILNMAAGILLFCLLAVFLRPVYLREQTEREETARAWAREQREADRAYQAEVEAERIRWEQMEDPVRVTCSQSTGTPDPEPYNDPDIPDDVEAAARRYGEAYGISPEFLEAVAWTESRYDPKAEKDGCIGLMQVAPRWHRDRMERLGLEESDLWEVEGSMAVAADYLRELFGICDDPFWVLMTYNGDSNAGDYLDGCAVPSEYALTVTELAFLYTQSHEEGGEQAWQED